MRQLIKNLMVCVLALGLAPAFAQTKPTPDSMQILREKLKADKKLVVAANMELKEAEAKAFWPIYEEYQKELAKINKRSADLVAEVTQIKQDREALIQSGEAIKANASKMDKDALKKAQEEYQAKATAFDPRIDAANKAKDAYVADSKAFDERVEAHNKVRDELNARIDKHMDAADDWKASCANKKYDEADELAIKKELAAAAK